MNKSNNKVKTNDIIGKYNKTYRYNKQFKFYFMIKLIKL